jgi:oligoribonuclease NrnB/cAMP/cGMP phosphodiesterase (DHH superfamily)
MADQSNRYSTENEFIVKNKNVIIYLLSVVTFFILIGFIDYYVLPVSKTTDLITHYSVQTTGKSKQKVSYHYFTQKGFTFSTAKEYIEESNIEIKTSLFFKSVTEVKSKTKNYTSLLSSGLSINGIQFYFCLVLLFSIGISLKILLSKKGFSENTFYNIVCFNSFMIFICLYMTYLF